jgi:hypothetical protein
VEKGGDYLLQIKANQPALLRQAQAAGAVILSDINNCVSM